MAPGLNKHDALMDFDFVVVGAGMAGLSVAAELSRSARVAVLERESQPGYHATGRSAALFSELYGNATIRALTRASRSFLFEPPAGFAVHPLVEPRGTLYFAAVDELAALDALGVSLGADAKPMRLDAAQTQAKLPVFKPGYAGGSLYEEGSVDIDVAALLQGYAAICKRQRASLHFDSPVEAFERDGAQWRVRSAHATLRAPVVVNAAGAWGDAIARLAGVAPVGLVPKRRTAVTIDVPGGLSAQNWPAAVHAAETFYFKPDAGRLLLSPADETPSEPCDAQPEELDIAIAVDKFQTASGSAVRRLHSRWAGLRSFVADKTPVVGFDDHAPGFFWLVGQGGYGIQTAPAMARAASALAQRADLPADLLAQGVSVDALASGRGGLRRQR
jgi:D-arginine dehydrogenase